MSTQLGWMPKRVIVIGLGGIGTHLVQALTRFLSHLKDGPKEMLLVDGDTYSEGNLARQEVLGSDVGKNKAQTWAQALAMEYKNLQISAKAMYVGVKNIHDLPIEDAVTFLCVDNHPTRKDFNEHFIKTIKSGSLLSGGNEKEDGSVIHHLKVDGNDLTPPIATFHPEIQNPKGKNPADLSCEELAKIPGGEQVIWANKSAALIMGSVFNNIVSGNTTRVTQFGEWYFDIVSMKIMPKVRLVPGKEVVVSPAAVLPVAEEKPAKGKKGKGKSPKAKKLAVSAIEAVREEDPAPKFSPVGPDVGDLHGEDVPEEKIDTGKPGEQ